jgi:ketosteroid isomerase-like protein
MRKLLTLTLFVLAHVSMFAQTEEEVIAADKKLNALLQARNAKEADALYFDDFILTTSVGKPKTKQDILKEITNSAVQMEINETTDVKVRLHGNTAVLTAVLRQKGTYNEKAFDVQLLVTDTWVKTPAGWKLLAGHAGKKPE